MHKYSSTQAKSYSKLGINESTSEPSYSSANKLFGRLNGKKVLDFGSGAGRSTLLIKKMGAAVVIGVDANKNMILQARKNHKERGLKFYHTKKTLPFTDKYFDAALCAHVLVESRSLKEMVFILNEIYRVLKNGGRLIIITSNPKSIGYDYKDYSYEKRKCLKSGDKTYCRMKGVSPFTIIDTYWTENDYKKAIKIAGFKIEKLTRPLAKGKGWLDETKVAPNIVYKCIKTDRE